MLATAQSGNNTLRTNSFLCQKRTLRAISIEWLSQSPTRKAAVFVELEFRNAFVEAVRQDNFKEGGARAPHTCACVVVRGGKMKCGLPEKVELRSGHTGRVHGAMANGCDDVHRAKELLRERLLSKNEGGEFSADTPPSAKEAVRSLAELLKSTVCENKGNSILIIGPRGVGKTWVTEAALGIIRNATSTDPFIAVHLNGLIHNDDRSALLSIAHQLDVENSFGDRLSLSFAAALNCILEALRSGGKKQQSVLFFLDEFDLFTQHKNQTLLYNLFDISMSPVTPVAVVGITCRLDVVELLEKRVKSRFSHRQLFIYPDYSFDEYCRLFVSLLSLSVDGVEQEGRGRRRRRERSFEEKWNEHLQGLVLNKVVREVLRKQYNCSPDIASLKTLLAYPVCKLGHGYDHITLADLQDSIQLCQHATDTKSVMLQGLSVLELCLIVSMKNITELSDGEPFNFEMVYEEYHKLVKQRSHSLQLFNKPVTLKAFERLVMLECVTPVSDSASSRLQKEFQLMRLMLDRQQIMNCIKTYPNCPTDLYYWATSSAIA